ncbi:hypothetical protein ACE38V_01565 [Cytobacillus sp. Hz8]|uniref:hypothetical protein n=1 Tax=Cytobacillus sp. Hz8 TaxID=3347168 RepID=UPI0035DAD319
MKSFSHWSFVFMVLGSLLFGINWMIEGYFEVIVIIGLVCFMIGMIFVFCSILKREKGNLKVISLIIFFLVFFYITWFKSFQVLRIVTWLKNSM